MIIGHLVVRRKIWFPTLLGWILILGIPASLVLLWWFRGEGFLSITDRRPAEVLVVEGWIGYEGIHAASEEFKQGGYRYVVTTSGLATNRWDRERYSYAGLAHDRLLQLGIDPDRIIVAMPTDTEGHRTFQSATAVWRALRVRNVEPTAINVFTLGAHARRSRLVFAKVFEPQSKVGVIAWTPKGYLDDRWWHSSERAAEMLRETVGFVFEALLNSGRKSNAPSVTLPAHS